MAKKKKVRVDLRKNRSKPPRQRDWTRQFEGPDFEDRTGPAGERVRAKGELSRRRTVIQQEPGAGAGPGSVGGADRAGRAAARDADAGVQGARARARLERGPGGVRGVAGGAGPEAAPDRPLPGRGGQGRGAAAAVSEQGGPGRAGAVSAGGGL